MTHVAVVQALILERQTQTAAAVAELEVSERRRAESVSMALAVAEERAARLEDRQASYERMQACANSTRQLATQALNGPANQKSKRVQIVCTAFAQLCMRVE